MNARPIGKDGKPQPEDIRKCGEEIKQYRNQQFILGTSALAIFGAYSVFMDKYLSAHADASNIFLLTSTAVLFLFFLLFDWMLTIRHWMVVTAAWLRKHGASTWEHDINKYHNTFKRKDMQSHTTMVVQIFHAVSIGVGALTVLVFKPEASDLIGTVIFSSSLVGYHTYVWYYGGESRRFGNDHASANWDVVIPPESDSPPILTDKADAKQPSES